MNTPDAKNRKNVVKSNIKCFIDKIRRFPFSLLMRLIESNITKQTKIIALRVVHWVMRAARLLWGVGGMMHISKVIDTTPITAIAIIVPSSKFDLCSDARDIFYIAIMSSTFLATVQYLTEK